MDHKVSVVHSPFLQACDLEIVQTAAKFTMIIFGGAGDLSCRKLLPALLHLYQERRIADCNILAVGRRKFSTRQFHTFIRKQWKKLGVRYDAKAFKAFKRQVHYLALDVTDISRADDLCAAIHGISPYDNLIYYAALHPTLLSPLVQMLARKQLCREKIHAKIVIEKPFGRDLETAQALNALLLESFDESQIYRMDHYLGKETVQNILFFRFANHIFEPIWNRNDIDNIQITVAEDIGIEGRGKFYEESGVIRDVIQNHVMQLIAVTTMEPPVGFAANFVRDQKEEVFQAMRILQEEDMRKDIVLGQYQGYLAEDGVDERSRTATFFAGKFFIDNWRWANVPIYVRAGKRMCKKATYIVVTFKHPPLKLLGRTCDDIGPNQLIIHIQPQEEIALNFSVKHPGSGNRAHGVSMLFNYAKSFHLQTYPAYERLLLECFSGDQTLFTRQDSVETTWSLVDPMIAYHARKRPHGYAAGSWGPESSDILIQKDGRHWYNL